MNDVIERLLRVQEADLELHRLEGEIRALAPRIEQLDRDRTRREQTLKKEEDAGKALAKKRADLERDLKPAEDRLVKARKQQELVRTPKEAEAAEHDLAAAQERVSRLEEEILALLDQEETAAAGLAQKRSAAATQNTRADEERSRLTTALAEKQSAARDAREDRIVAANRLSSDEYEDARHHYEWALKTYGPPAVVKLRGEACGGCGGVLVPHVIQRVQRAEEVVQCEHCRRFLYA